MYGRKEVIEFLVNSGVAYKTTPQIFTEPEYYDDSNSEADWLDSLRLNTLEVQDES